MIGTLFHDTLTPNEIREKVSSLTPMRREGGFLEVADLVYLLASDQASIITGANITSMVV